MSGELRRDGRPHPARADALRRGHASSATAPSWRPGPRWCARSPAGASTTRAPTSRSATTTSGSSTSTCAARPTAPPSSCVVRCADYLVPVDGRGDPRRGAPGRRRDLGGGAARRAAWPRAADRLDERDRPDPLAADAGAARRWPTGSPDLAALSPFLADPDPQVRRAAVATLTEVVPEGAGPALAAALLDARTSVRAAAAAALRELVEVLPGDDELRAALLTALTAPDPVSRAAVLDVLRALKLGGEELVPGLPLGDDGPPGPAAGGARAGVARRRGRGGGCRRGSRARGPGRRGPRPGHDRRPRGRRATWSGSRATPSRWSGRLPWRPRQAWPARRSCGGRPWPGGGAGVAGPGRRGPRARGGAGRRRRARSLARSADDVTPTCGRRRSSRSAAGPDAHRRARRARARDQGHRRRRPRLRPKGPRRPPLDPSPGRWSAPFTGPGAPPV